MERIAMGVQTVLVLGYAASVLPCEYFVSASAWLYVALGMAYLLRQSFEAGTEVGHALRRQPQE
jgi:hypothetical protein